MSPRRPDMGHRFAALEERVRRLERQVEDQVTLDRRLVASFSAPGTFSTTTNTRKKVLVAGATVSLIVHKRASGSGTATFTIGKNGTALETVNVTTTTQTFTTANIVYSPGDTVDFAVTAADGDDLDVWCYE